MSKQPSQRERDAAAYAKQTASDAAARAKQTASDAAQQGQIAKWAHKDPDHVTGRDITDWVDAGRPGHLTAHQEHMAHLNGAHAQHLAHINATAQAAANGTPPQAHEVANQYKSANRNVKAV